MVIDNREHLPTKKLFGRSECLWLAEHYHDNDVNVRQAAENFTPEQFLRFFITAYGMKPVGTWQTHTYARYTDSETQNDHFFLIPIVNAKNEKKPWIRFENNFLKIDDIETNIYPQSIPHTTPFWYFHYNPNTEDRPYTSMTLNLSPSCLEKCVLCAGAKTGRVNNGMETTMSPKTTVERIFNQHPNAKAQLDSVAIVTGCFPSFEKLREHLTDVRHSIDALCAPSTYRVLEHNIVTEDQLEIVVGQLGYDIFITLECFDQEVRNIALNGKVGRKGRDSKEFIQIIKNYANYLDTRPELGKRIVRVTYLMGLDSLSVTEDFFRQLAEINSTLRHTKVLPWLSIFTAYNEAMRVIQQDKFGLPFLVDAVNLSEKYFDPQLLAMESGGTADGYARGLF